MIYTLFLYQSESGVLMYDKIMQDVSSGKLELFSAFFSAIKAVISNLVLEGSKELKNIGLGDYLVTITNIPEIKADIVLINDKEDKKIIDKLVPKIIKVLINFEDIFYNWNGDRTILKVIDQPITALLLSNKKLRKEGASLTDNPEQVLRSIWEHEAKFRGKLSKEAKLSLVNRRAFLLENFNNEVNLLKKSAILKQVLILSEKLKDENGFLEYQKEIKHLNDEITDTKRKLVYYLSNTKKTLSDAIDVLGSRSLNSGDYKEAYLNLYSFSTKLKFLSNNQQPAKYRDLAKKLIEREELSHHELSGIISQILNLSDNINEYLS